MAKPNKIVTPDNRVEKWKKLWATPRLLDGQATEAAFEEFQEAFVPGHMLKRFLKTFGLPKADFGNRFFAEDASYHPWDTTLGSLMQAAGHAEVIVIYALPDRQEAHWLRGEMRRSIRDIFIDDWQAACAIATAGDTKLYAFIEPKMKGGIVRVVRGEGELS